MSKKKILVVMIDEAAHLLSVTEQPSGGGKTGALRDLLQEMALNGRHTWAGDMTDPETRKALEGAGAVEDET